MRIATIGLSKTITLIGSSTIAAVSRQQREFEALGPEGYAKKRRLEIEGGRMTCACGVVTVKGPKCRKCKRMAGGG